MLAADARQVLQGRFFGIEENEHFFGVKPTEVQLAALQEVKITPQVLDELEGNGTLLAVFPLSIRTLREKFPHFYGPERNPWYLLEEFGEAGKANHMPRWHFVFHNPLPMSWSRTWERQVELLGARDAIPTARVLTYAMLASILNTRSYMYVDRYDEVRCSDRILPDKRVTVGYETLRGEQRICIQTASDVASPARLGAAREHVL